MQIEINSIVIHKRARYSLGELTSLMESLRKYGQICPILVNRRSVLIAGNRRLESARRLGWERINAIVVNKDSAQETLELELEENIQRKELWPEELREAIERLQRLQRIPWWRRVAHALPRLITRILTRPIARAYARLFRRRRTDSQG